MCVYIYIYIYIYIYKKKNLLRQNSCKSCNYLKVAYCGKKVTN